MASATYEQLAQKDYDDIPDMEALSKGADSRASGTKPSQRSCSSLALILLAILLACSGFALGMLYAKQSSAQLLPELRETVNKVPINTIARTFKYDTSFASLPPPRGTHEASWDELIPNGYGYVKQAPLAPELSVISAFHQLHCLYRLRRSFYDPAPETSPPSPLPSTGSTSPGNGTEDHVQHCFEYLRQSILCAADSSIEPASEEKVQGRFPGWGFARQCRDYDALKGWAEQARALDGEGFEA